MNHSPIKIMKSRKNETEIKNIEKAFLQDSIAMCYFLSWYFPFFSLFLIIRIEDHIDEGVSEYLVGLKSTEFRKTIGGSYGDSFDPIVGSGANAAIVHYSAKPETAARLQRDHCILLDTGGQYHFGTTDITRTICIASDDQLSKVDPAFRECYTAVLRGHIDLMTAVFPEGTRGIQLDCLARQPLWELGLDFGHGTGHGVGYYSGVHEGPEVRCSVVLDYHSKCLLEL